MGKLQGRKEAGRKMWNENTQTEAGSLTHMRDKRIERERGKTESGSQTREGFVSSFFPHFLSLSIVLPVAGAAASAAGVWTSGTNRN